MNLVKKLIAGLALAFSCLVPSAFAAQSVLPQVDEAVYWACEPVNINTQDGLTDAEIDWMSWKGLFETDPDILKDILDEASKDDIEAILGCALKTGEIQFWMVPYYVIFAMEFVIELAGLIVVLMIMVGAYYYIAGGLTQDKEKGKTIITYAIGGFILTLSSWILVNILLLALTS